MPKVIENACVYQAVMQVVMERGYVGATTKQMAEAAGISEVSLFRKYENKRELVRKAITWLASQVDFAAAAQHTGNLRTDLMRMVKAYQDSAVQYGPFFVVILSEMPRNPELVELIDKPLKVFTSMSQVLARYQEEGVLRVEHPLHALAALLGPLVYSTLIQGAMGDSSIPPLDLSHHVDCYIYGRLIA